MAESNKRYVSCDCGCKVEIDQASVTWIRVPSVIYGSTTMGATTHVLDFIDWSHLAQLANYFAANPPPIPTTP